MNVYAIIPARGGSKGILRKNLERVADKPLVAHAIAHAQQAVSIDQVWVSSEDEEIRQVAATYGAKVISRPAEFTKDSTVQEVDRLLVWTVKALEEQGHQIDVVVLLYPTAPLRDVASINKAVAMVTTGDYDSVLSLYEDKTYLWRRVGDVVEPINYDPMQRGPRQMEAWNQWAENKAIYVVKRDLLVETGCRIAGRVGSVEMSYWHSIDVDTQEDLRLVRTLLEQKS